MIASAPTTAVAMAVQARAAALLRDATVRWLVKEELAFLLLHHAQLGVPTLRTLQLRPTSGRLLLYDTRDVPDFKKDGWRWQKRKDQSGRVREDRAKLVINRETIVLGTYVHSSDVATFHRRSYALRDADPHIVLVHYFDEVHKASNAAMAAASASSSNRTALLPAASAPVTSVAVQPTPAGSALLSQKAAKGLKRALPVSVRPVGMTAAPAAAAAAASVLKPALRSDAAATDESVDAIMNNCFELDFLQHDAPSLTDDSSRELDFDLLRSNGMLMDGLSDFSDDLLYPLESVPAPIKLGPEGHTSSSANVSAAASTHALAPAHISDFSPDWDFTDGGAKVLICLAAPLPPCPPTHMQIFVQFGILNRVPAEKISDTVVRCTAPPSNSTGSKEIYVCCSRDALDPACMQLSSKRSFTYKSPMLASPALTSSQMTNAAIAGAAPFKLESSDTSVDCGVTAAAAAASAQHEVASGKRGRSPRRIGELRQHRLGRQRSDRASEPSNLSSFVDTALDERQCKIRVVERLSEFHHAIWTTATPSELLSVPEPAVTATAATARSLTTHSSVPPSPLAATAHVDSTATGATIDSLDATATDSVLAAAPVAPLAPATTPASPADATSASLLGLDDSTIETLSDPDLEQLSEQLLERVVRQLVTVAHTSDELLEELNSLDESGLSLLHYVSFYNYAQLVLLLLSHGAHINQESTQGQTALHLAAGCGHQDVVDVLVDSGADLAALDFGACTAADRADKSGHADVAAYLRRLMGSSSSNSNGDRPGGDSERSAVSTPEQPSVASTSVSPLRTVDDAFAMDIDDFGIDDLERNELSRLASTDSPVRSADTAADSSASSTKSKHYAGENHEHNRKLLLGAFSTMSLHDKCALSLSISRDANAMNSRRRNSSIGDDAFLSNGGGGNTGPDGDTGAGVGGPSASTNGGSSTSSSAARSLTASPAAHERAFGTDAELLPSGNSSTTENDSLCDSDVKSVIADDAERLTKLEAAMALMGPEERQSLEDEVKLLQHNIRAWLLKRNCKHMRETTKRLHEATQSIEDHQQQQQQQVDSNSNSHASQLEQLQSQQQHPYDALSSPSPPQLSATSWLSERERAAVTVQAATRSMLARKSFLQTKNVTIRVQAATRGVLCRKHFARMKTHALASLVIQRNVREWWYKQQPAGSTSSTSEVSEVASRAAAATASHTIADDDDDNDDRTTLRNE